MLLNDVVETSADVAAESGRKAKTVRIADLLAPVDPDTASVVVGFLTGDLRQGRVGVGLAALRDLPPSAAVDPTLTVAHIDAVIDEIQTTTGPGSKARRAEILGASSNGRCPPSENSS